MTRTKPRSLKLTEKAKKLYVEDGRWKEIPSEIKLYYHKTDGGAEYLMDTYINWSFKGKKGKEGRITDKTKYIVRIDGDITKDTRLIIK